MHRPDFHLTYRRPVLILTVPDNAVSCLGNIRYDTSFEEMVLLPWFVENERIEILLYSIGHIMHYDL